MNKTAWLILAALAVLLTTRWLQRRKRHQTPTLGLRRSGKERDWRSAVYQPKQFRRRR